MPIGALAMAGLNTAQQAAQAGMGLILEGHNDRRQLRQQRDLQNLQIEGDKALTDYNMSKQLQMWKDTNYGPQMEQLKKAGLNPGLIYGMSGGGATTTGQANGNVSGTHAPSGGGEILAMQQMGIQRELLQAQKENIQANTEKTKAETGNVPLTGKNIEANTASITQGIENQKTAKTLMEIQDSLLRNDLFEKYSTQDDRFQIYANDATKGIEEAMQAMIQTGIDQATAESKITLLKATAVGQILKNALTQSETQNVNQDTKNKYRQLINSIEENMRAWDTQSINTQKWSREFYEKIRDENDFPREIKDAIDNILIVPRLGKGMQGTTPIKGFRQ